MDQVCWWYMDARWHGPPRRWGVGQPGAAAAAAGCGKIMGGGTVDLGSLRVTFARVGCSVASSVARSEYCFPYSGSPAVASLSGISVLVRVPVCLCISLGGGGVGLVALRCCTVAAGGPGRVGRLVAFRRSHDCCDLHSAMVRLL